MKVCGSLEVRNRPEAKFPIQPTGLDCAEAGLLRDALVHTAVPPRERCGRQTGMTAPARQQTTPRLKATSVSLKSSGLCVQALDRPLRAVAAGRRGALGLTRRAEIPKLNAWFGRANRARGLLSTPVRAELVLLELLRDWPARSSWRASGGR